MNETCESVRSILLVDDDPLVVKVYAERMRFEGWQVAVARDGWDACQEAKTSRYDMILLDIRMPFQDGVEVLKEIRNGELNAVTPIYILTGLKESEEVDDALRLGAEGVFYKADNRPDELVSKIRRILARSSAEPISSPRDPSSGKTGSIPALPADVPPGLFDPVEDDIQPSGVIDREPDFELGFLGTGSDRRKSRPTSGPDEDAETFPDVDREDGPASVVESQGWSSTEFEEEFGFPQESDPLPQREPAAQSAPTQDLLFGSFRLYVNPFLGDGAKLSETLGLKGSYLCPDCSGQICLDLDAGPDGIQAHFVCSRCKGTVV